MPVRYNDFMRKMLCACLLFALGCTPVLATGTPLPETLIPYETIAPSAIPIANTLVSPGALLKPSPTPLAYTIRSGDTLGGIAQRFHVSLDILLAANPDVNPNAMTVGKTIQVPGSLPNEVGNGSPTPAPFMLEQAGCYPTLDKALWCFALARNDGAEAMEDITAQMRLVDAKGQQVGSEMALLPLDVLPASAALPMSAYFKPGIPLDAKLQVQVLTAVRLAAGDGRYLDAHVQNTQFLLDWSGRSGEASGVVRLMAGGRSAHSISVAAVAYDAAGRVVGVRRWDSQAALPAGETLPFSFQVASIAGEIARIDFAVEARP